MLSSYLADLPFERTKKPAPSRRLMLLVGSHRSPVFVDKAYRVSDGKPRNAFFFGEVGLKIKQILSLEGISRMELNYE